MTLADESHLDPCAGRHCTVVLLRSEMKRLPGKRGWFCPRCQILHGGNTKALLDLSRGARYDEEISRKGDGE